MIRAARCNLADVHALLHGIASPKTDAAGVVDVDACAARGQVFMLTDDGRPVAAYVLEPLGAALWISAFGGRARFDLVQALAALVEIQAGEFESIGFRTERRGLVKKARREGYHVERTDGRAYVMRKNLRP